MLTTILLIVLSGLLWRLRGIMGWPFTVLFAAAQAFPLMPVIGGWVGLFALWIMLGEPTGWKPKYITDRTDWFWAAVSGLKIGGIGAIAVPLSSWLHDRFGEPPFPNNPREYTLPFWTQKKRLLDWRGAWNEVYFGMIFSGIIQAVVLL